MSRPTRHTHHAKAGTGSRAQRFSGVPQVSRGNLAYRASPRDRETSPMCGIPRKRQKVRLEPIPSFRVAARSRLRKVAKWQSGKVAASLRNADVCASRGCRGQLSLPIVGTIEVMGERAWRSPGTGVRDVRRACGGTAFFHEKREKQGDLTSLVPSGTGTAADGLNSSI